MASYPERIEAALDELEERRQFYLAKADEIANKEDVAFGDDMLSLRYGAIAEGLSQAEEIMRRARVPHSLAGYIPEHGRVMFRIVTDE